VSVCRGTGTGNECEPAACTGSAVLTGLSVSIVSSGGGEARRRGVNFMPVAASVRPFRYVNVAGRGSDVVKLQSVEEVRTAAD